LLGRCRPSWRAAIRARSKQAFMVSTKWLCSSIVMCSRSYRAILRANQVDFCFWRAASASLRAPRRAGSRSQFQVAQPASILIEAAIR
jgi:hypothetical protein